ncbi:Vang-like protein [Aphelenchoides besseyi]|nr:Vang-like protein [Aphelenchoides besseyi]
MSLASQRISHPYRSNRHGRPAGTAHSVITGYEFDRSPLIPGYSGGNERNVKVNMMDDNMDNTTVVSQDPSYCGGLPERYNSVTSAQTKAKNSRCECSNVLFMLIRFILCTITIFSAAAMVAFPFVLNYFGRTEIVVECGVDCEAGLFHIAALTVALGFAVCFTWRSSTSTLPRLSCAQTSFHIANAFVLFSFWTFYIFRTLLKPSVDFRSILWFAMTLLFLLITIHILWNSYQRRGNMLQFRIDIVRDPDGEQHEMIINAKSIQDAAVEVLNFYHTKFSHFNPYAEQARSKAFDTKCAPSINFKIYDVEQGSETILNESNIGKLIEVAGRQSGRVHSELYGQEAEKERKVEKRKYRLIAATEEAFSRLQSINEEYSQKNGNTIRSSVAVKAVMTSISKPLNRFLKTTFKHLLQQPQAITDHLEFCYRNGLSARVFLSYIFRTTPPVRNEVSKSKWTIACHTRASASLYHGLQFILRCYYDVDAGVQLVCSVSQLGCYNLKEETVSTKIS